jgi:hypothetical protein
MEKSVSLVEHSHLTEMHASLKRKLMEAQLKDQARMDSVRNSVLTKVVQENYDAAKFELEEYVQYKSNFPEFQQRAERYVAHCGELIYAIQTKRNFPGLASLSLAKQQEVHEKVIHHFEELKHNLKMLERVERENKLNDIRSTVWVLRTLCQVVAAIFIVGLVLDLEAGMFSSGFLVINHAIDQASNWVVGLVGL